MNIGFLVTFGVFCLVGIYSFVKNIRGFIGYLNCRKLYKDSSEIKRKCSEQLSSKVLSQFDEVYESLTPDRLDPYTVRVKKEKAKLNLSKELCIAINTYDSVRFEGVKKELKCKKRGILKDIYNCIHSDIDNVGLKISTVKSDILNFVAILSVTNELDTMEKTIKLSLNEKDLNLFSSHIEGRLSSLNALSSFICKGIEEEYRLKVEDLCVQNYSILKYNKDIALRVVQMGDLQVVEKIDKLFKDLNFRVTKLNDKTYILNSDVSFTNYLIHISLDRKSRGVLTRDIVDTDELEKLEKLAEQTLKENYKITLITNRNFSQEAFRYIIDTYKIECLTLDRLLELPIIAEEEATGMRKGLMLELVIKNLKQKGCGEVEFKKNA